MMMMIITMMIIMTMMMRMRMEKVVMRMMYDERKINDSEKY
jgi:hypothetical protein